MGFCIYLNYSVKPTMINIKPTRITTSPTAPFIIVHKAVNVDGHWIYVQAPASMINNPSIIFIDLSMLGL